MCHGADTADCEAERPGCPSRALDRSYRGALYSFWLDGEFWGDAAAELVIPGAPDTDSRTADVALDELRLNAGARIAYVFDYGDEWRVMLTLRERVNGGNGMPLVAERRGTAPPHYPPLEDE